MVTLFNQREKIATQTIITVFGTTTRARKRHTRPTILRMSIQTSDVRCFFFLAGDSLLKNNPRVVMLAGFAAPRLVVVWYPEFAIPGKVFRHG